MKGHCLTWWDWWDLSVTTSAMINFEFMTSKRNYIKENLTITFISTCSWILQPNHTLIEKKGLGTPLELQLCENLVPKAHVGTKLLFTWTLGTKFLHWSLVFQNLFFTTGSKCIARLNLPWHFNLPSLSLLLVARVIVIELKLQILTGIEE